MPLTSMIQEIATSVKAGLPDWQLVWRVRQLFARAIVDASFVEACVLRSVSIAEQCILEGQAYRPLHADPHLNWRLTMFLWPKLTGNSPHLHHTWGVTGVLSNRLEVTIYEQGDTPRDLRVRRHFLAGRGEAGYLVPPCIHSLRNPHPTLSTVTLHAFGYSSDVRRPDLDTTWIDDRAAVPPSDDPAAFAREDLLICLALLKEVPGVRSEALLCRIFEVGGVKVRLVAFKQLVQINSTRTSDCGERLLGDLRGRDRERFLQLHECLHASTYS